MNTNEKNVITITDEKAQYDEYAIEILSNKKYLSHILSHTVNEFRDMHPRDVEKLIEGEICVNKVPISPNETNATDGRQIVGMNTVDKKVDEDTVVFDILFYVLGVDGLTKIIINLEAQKDEPSGYGILSRATYYACRMVSSQKGRDFTGSHYDDIKKVYSIWVCMNMVENVRTDYNFTPSDIVGHHNWKGKSDLLNVVMIGLADDLPEHTKEYELHRLLGTLFSMDRTIEQRCEIIENEYGIKMTNDMKEDLDTMCNLSTGIEERGYARGEARGISIGESRGKSQGERSIILALLANGLTIEQISNYTNKSVQEVQELVSGEATVNS